MSRWNTEKKNEMRDAALIYKGGPVKSAILFPGEEYRCLRQGTASGLFDPKQTAVLCIERNPKIALGITKELRRLGFKKAHVHDDEVFRLQKSQLELFFGKQKVQYAFLDFCNQLNQETAFWLVNQCNSIFGRNSVVNFTFAMQTINKSNSFLDAVQPDSARLFPCMEVPNVEVEDKFHGQYRDDYRITAAGLWLVLSENYSVKVTDILGYTAKKCPMLLIKSEILSAAPASNRGWLSRTIHVSHRIEPVNRQRADWEKIGCHPLMRDALKSQFVQAAKKGQRPVWMLPAEWAWNSINPNGQNHRRRAA
jgi:hypothetical protein